MRLAFAAPLDSVHTQRWVSHFSARHEVYTFTGHLPPTTYDLDSVGRTRIRHLLRIINLRRNIRRVKPDILHAHYAVTYGLYSALSGFHPFIISIWGSDLLIAPKMYHRVVRRAVNYALSSADVIHTDSRFATELVAKIDERLRNKVYEIPWGIDLTRFNHSMSKDEIRRRLGLPSEKMLVISMRNLESIYDPFTQVKSAEALRNEGKDFLWLISGDGSLESQLHRYIHEKNLEENVLLTGRVQPSLVPEYLAATDLYVNTSLSDTISIALMEAMASRLPVVTTDVGAHGEWIKDGQGGYIVQKQDPQTLTQHVNRLMTDQSLRGRFGETNYRIVEEKGDWHRNMEKIERIYEKL